MGLFQRFFHAFLSTFPPFPTFSAFANFYNRILVESVFVIQFVLLNEILVTQSLVRGWAAYDEALQEFYVYCALESMFTKEDKLELERRQGGVTTLEASDLGYKAGWVWVGDKETGDWVWSETGEWPESPKQETKEDQDIDEFLKIWTGV